MDPSLGDTHGKVSNEEMDPPKNELAKFSHESALRNCESGAGHSRSMTKKINPIQEDIPGNA